MEGRKELEQDVPRLPGEPRDRKQSLPLMNLQCCPSRPALAAVAAMVSSLLPEGEGLLLLIDIIRLLSPSHIVQMDVYDWKAMAPLSPDYVHFTSGLYTKGKQQSKCKKMRMDGAEPWSPFEGAGDASAPQYKLLYIHPEFPRAGSPGEV